MQQTECSKMLAYKIQMPGNYPEESIQHSEHGKSLKSRSIFLILYIFVMLRLQCILSWFQPCAEIWKIPARISHVLNIFCERMAGYLTFISVISDFDSWNNLFRFSFFRTFVTLRCLIQVIHIEMVMVITESVISDVYLLYIFAYNFQRF
jgi:hypothetical protein